MNKSIGTVVALMIDIPIRKLRVAARRNGFDEKAAVDEAFRLAKEKKLPFPEMANRIADQIEKGTYAQHT